MKKLFFPVVILFLFFSCQEPPHSRVSGNALQADCRIMFWNAENLFDCYKDSLKDDDEFLPFGIRGWTTARYKQKLKNMYKVFIAAGDWNPPDLIGLCEIENKNVLYGLLRDTPFSYFNYRFVHYESPDRRGIDVALLYNPARVEVVDEGSVPVVLSAKTGYRGRDILYVRVRIACGDTLSLFVNHWPSKFGGAGYTADLRENVASILSGAMTEVLRNHPGEKIIAMGDFNDPPESSSFDALGFAPDSAHIPLLVNLASDYKADIPGSYKFQGSWQLIDQFLVSQNFLSGEEGAVVNPSSFSVFAPDFLLERDEKFGGMKPFRTYAGFAYNAGFSDHLPIILDLFMAP